MSSSTCLIQPFNYTVTYGQFIVTSVHCQLFTGAIVTIALYDTKGNFIQNQKLPMNTTDYNNWGSSDTFIINWVCTQMGFTAQTTTTTTTTSS